MHHTAPRSKGGFRPDGGGGLQGFGGVAEGGKVNAVAAVVAAVAVEGLLLGGHLVKEAHIAFGVGEAITSI